MRVVDNTKTISNYLARKVANIRAESTCGTGGWCRFMTLADGTFITRKTLFLRREVLLPNIIHWFEIWDEHTIAIPRDAWNDVYPKIESAVKNFEQETGQSITIKKVKEMTQWAEY